MSVLKTHADEDQAYTYQIAHCPKMNCILPIRESLHAVNSHSTFDRYMHNIVILVFYETNHSTKWAQCDNIIITLHSI